MFGFGFGEMLLLMAIGLIVLGPKQLPQVARVIGRTIAEIKKALHEVTSSVAVDFKEENKKSQAPSPEKLKVSTETPVGAVSRNGGTPGATGPAEAPQASAPPAMPPGPAVVNPPNQPFVFQELPPHPPMKEIPFKEMPLPDGHPAKIDPNKKGEES